MKRVWRILNIVAIFAWLLVGSGGIYHSAIKNQVTPDFVLTVLGVGLAISTGINTALMHSIDTKVDRLSDKIDNMNQRLTEHIGSKHKS